MTSVLKISVQDGLVFAADSRTTVGHNGNRVRVFDGVKKIFTLHSDFPVAMATWGQNRIGGLSVERLMREVQARLSGASVGHADWKLDVSVATISDLGAKVANFLYHEHYLKAVESGEKLEELYLHFAGFSAGKMHPGHAEYCLTPEHMHGPKESDGGAVQVNFTGAYVTRLMVGTDVRVMSALVEAGVAKEVIQDSMKTVGTATLRDLVSPGMPLSEVAALARGVMNTEITLSRFGPEPDMVGGDIQMVVIDKDSCREMKFKPIDFQIPPSVWKRGHRLY